MLNEDVLGGGATLLGLPLPLVLKGLSILSAPTGCDGIVDMSAFNSLGNIGSNWCQCYRHLLMVLQ